MKKIKKIISVLALVAFITAMSTSCNKDVKSGDDKKAADQPKAEVVYWLCDWGGRITNIHKMVVDAFNEKNPDINVKLQVIPFSTQKYTAYDDKFLPAIVAGNGPDIFYAAGIGALVDEDIVMDLTDEVTKIPGFSLDDFYENSRDALYYNGKVYMLPYENGVIGFLTYNKTLFKKVGLDPNSPPETMDELDRMAEKLTLADENGDYIHVGFIPQHWLFKYARHLFACFGGRLADENDNATISTPENIQALTWLQNYMQKYGYDKISKLMGSKSNAAEPFDFGVVGMNYSFVGHINNLIKADVSFEWDIAPFPGVTEDISPSCSGGWNICVSSKPRNKEAAIRFATFFTGKPGQDIMMSKYHEGNLYTFSAVKEANDKYKANWHPAMGFIIDKILPITKPWYTFKIHPQYENMMNDLVFDVIKGTVEPRQGLDDVSRRLDQLLEEAKKSN